MAGQRLLNQGEKRRGQIYKFIVRYHQKHGWAPTIAEIAKGTGLVSPNATRNHLLRLQEEGFITLGDGGARCIRLNHYQLVEKGKLAA